MSAKQTDAPQFISDLSGGNFAQGLGIALTEVAQGVVATGKKGKVQITLDIARIGDSNQVKIAHTLATLNQRRKVNAQKTLPLKLRCTSTQMAA